MASIKQFLSVLALAFVAVLATGCNDAQSKSADQAQAEKTAQIAKAANQSVGMPNIKNFREKRLVKMLYELRDTELPTYTYFMDMNGNLHFLCNSVGYGINASVQYSNPERIGYAKYQYGVATLPQPEPNGLFMPEGLSATYAMCVYEGKVKPVYVEQELTVSPFKLDHIQ